MDNETTTDAPETFRDRIRVKLENPKIKKIGKIAAATTAVAAGALSFGLVAKFSKQIDEMDEEPTEDDLELETTETL